MRMFIVLSSSQAIARVYAMNTARFQVAADLWTKPTDLSHKPTYRQPVNRIHHRHLLLLLSLKADTHFTVSQRVEG